MIQVTPVILCGGSGTRLWPLSRTGFPKQFLCLTGNESLFQQAAQRLAGLSQEGIQVAAPLIVSGEDHRFLASEQLREVGINLGTALLEPEGRNTAPALTLAALAATENGQDPVLVVTPADQTVANTAAFTSAVQQAIAQAAQGNIVILGVTPDKPETGYPDIHLKEDYALWASIFACGAKAANMPETLVRATTGRDMYRRRGGIRYALAEIALQKHLVNVGLKSKHMAILHGLARSTIFLMPSSIRGWIYKKILRKVV